MQTEEQAKFRLNWQVAVVIVVAMIALALPIALVISALSKPRQPAPQEAAQSAAEPLEKALETIVDKGLGSSDPEITSDNKVVIFAENPETKAGELEKLAINLGGMSLPAERQGNDYRLVVTMPAAKLAEFNKALLGDGFKNGPQAGVEASILITVLIKSKAAP